MNGEGLTMEITGFKVPKHPPFKLTIYKSSPDCFLMEESPSKLGMRMRLIHNSQRTKNKD